MQFSLGKSRRGYGPMGPWVVTPDELEPYRAGNAYDLEMTAAVNGEPYSAGRLSARGVVAAGEPIL